MTQGAGIGPILPPAGSGGGGGSGTVETVSVVTADGFAGTVATPTTTPAITISTTVTGVLKGNGTAISAAVNGTDYYAPSTFSSAGQLFAGTGAGTGELLSKGTAGQVLTVGGADPSGLEWATPGGGSGTVTSVSVVSANGLAGTVATSTTTPAITLSTSITGLLKGNGTAISAATAGTDYLAPTGSGAGLTGIVTTFNTRTGSVTLGAADIEGTFGSAGQLFVGTGSGTGTLLGIGTANQVLAVNSGGTALVWTTPGSGGTVTSVSVVSANGLAGTVATATTTPTITLSTSVNAPILAGNGTAIAAATTTGTGTTAVLSGSPALTGTPTAPTGTTGDTSTQIATDAFVATAITNALAGINPAVAVQAATTTASNTSAYTYNNGVGGVGATLTGVNNTPFTVDGFTFTALGQRVLVKNDTQSPSGAFNGVYSVTQLQGTLLPVILTRALDYDQPSDINNSGAIPVLGGSTQANTLWLLTTQVTTVGTNPLSFTQFAATSTVVPSQYNYSTVTADPAPAVIGTVYETNYAASGSFTLPSSGLVAGDWIKVFQAANNTLTFVGTVNGDTGYALTTQNQSAELIYNGTGWRVF